MPELRNVRPRQAIAAFERAGGVRKSGKGDHVNIKMPNGQIVTFSGVREPIKIGLLKAMLRKAGLTETEFVQFLEGEMKEYLVVIHHAEEGGYWAEVPALEGCFAQGETVEEVLDDARGAIISHLASLAEDGQSLPEESGILIATVTLTAA